ncbi:MAG TPA: hypothetical protein VFG23_22360 [Polyangia bacterium]|nr:hypothetical protein [Polyangia bacterium]
MSTAALVAVVLGIGVPVAGVGTMIGLVVQTDRRVRTAVPRLAALPCPHCGVAIGAKAASSIAAARKAAVRKIVDAAQARSERRRIDPGWRLACPACGTKLEFDPAASREPLTRALSW